MRQIRTVARREFRGYFDHATAYILVVAFLALALFLTFRSLYASGAASMRSLFTLLPWLFAVFVPAITMRSFAEERRSGTLEWLISQPLTETDVIAGKFLGSWLFVMAALAGTVPAALGVLVVSDADAGMIAAQYIGAALFAAQLVAIGLFTSTLTANQITAFILAVAANFTLVLAGLPIVLMGLPPVLAQAVTQLAVLTHFEGIARGVLDLRDLLYFLTTAALFLTLAYLLLVGGRLSSVRGALRRLRIGVAGIAMAVLVLNLLGARIHGRLDLTSDNLYTLSQGTEHVIESLDDVVTVRLVVSRELPPEIGLTLRDVRDLLADYQRASRGQLRISELNPDESDDAAEEASALGIQPIQFNVVRDDEFQVRRGWFGLAVLYADEREIIPVVDRTQDLEYRLTTMIASMTRETTPRMAFIAGASSAGPPRQFMAFQQAMRQHYDVEIVDLEQTAEPPAAPDEESDSADVAALQPEAAPVSRLSPDSFDVAVVAGGDTPFNEAAVEQIRGFIDGGGAALLLLDGNGIDPQMGVSRPVTTGLESLLESQGLRLGSGLVYDLRSNQQVSLGRRGIFPIIASYPLWPVALPAGDHTLTRNLDALALAWATPLEIVDSARVQPLWQTTQMAGRRPAGSPIMPEFEIRPTRAELAQQLVAAAIDAGTDTEGAAGDEGGAPADRGRLVVVGNAEFLTDGFAQNNPQNVIFAANAVDWLAQDEALIGIRSKDRTPPPLVFESEGGQAALKWANLIGVPLLFVAFGATRVMQRRRLSDRSWQEVIR
ncbi:MAG: Gldg family protein [Longimicrobiales bacterium]